MGKHFSGGIITYNLREGFRSEYLAHFVFSALGPSIPVSVADDYGIDLLCNITEINGKMRNVKTSYGVQVKSGDTKFEYKGKQAIEWLFQLEYPILLASVKKDESKIDVYTTWNINRLLLSLDPKNSDSFPKKILFKPNQQIDIPTIKNGLAIVPIGKPIISLSIEDISDINKVNDLVDIVKEWIEFDSENYLYRRVGLPMVRGFTDWEINKPLSKANREWCKQFFYSPHHFSNTRKLIADTSVAVALYLKASNNNTMNDECKKLKEYISQYCASQLDDFGKDIFEL